MPKLLTILSLILIILLFPPATLALISNNAIPGDRTYPIKRGLEDVIFAVVSVNPVSKAWFAAARSDRRFEEFSNLVVQKKSTTNTLDELVSQTDTAEKEISKIEGNSQKKELLDKLSTSIGKYDKQLKEVSKIQTPTPTPTPQPAQVVATPLPSSATSNNAGLEELERQRREIEEARRRLEEIKRRIEEEQRKLKLQEQTTSNMGTQASSSPIPTSTPTRTPSPTPTPTPQPTPTPTPIATRRPTPSPTARPARDHSFSVSSAGFDEAPESSPSASPESNTTH